MQPEGKSDPKEDTMNNSNYEEEVHLTDGQILTANGMPPMMNKDVVNHAKGCEQCYYKLSEDSQKHVQRQAAEDEKRVLTNVRVMLTMAAMLNPDTLR